MDIGYRNTKLRKIFDTDTQLKRKFGPRSGLKIIDNLAYLRLAPSLATVPAERPLRCHQLSGDRDEQFAIDLVQPFRLVFEVAHDPIPRDEFGGIDKRRVTAIRIIEVIDYH